MRGDRKVEVSSIKYSDIDGNRITIVREKKKTRERIDIELSDRLHELVQKQIANPVLPKCKGNDKNYRKEYCHGSNGNGEKEGGIIFPERSRDRNGEEEAIHSGEESRDIKGVS